MLKSNGKTVSRIRFKKESDRYLKRISRILTKQFGKIGGFDAGNIVDIDFEADKDGIVGLRLDNNFGVVNRNDAVKFADALAYATRIAYDFKYLGCTVER